MLANWIIVLPCWSVEGCIVPIEKQYALLRREIKGCQTFMGERISYARLRGRGQGTRNRMLITPPFFSRNPTD